MRNCSNRITVSFAVAAFVSFAGIHSLAAQDQAATVIEKQAAAAAMAIQRAYVWPEMGSLLADPDGLNSPNTGFGYEIPAVNAVNKADQRIHASPVRANSNADAR